MRYLSILALLFLAACGGGGDDEPVDEDRKSVIPVICKDKDGNVIPGMCV